jgi:hypothetical protein
MSVKREAHCLTLTTSHLYTPFDCPFECGFQLTIKSAKMKRVLEEITSDDSQRISGLLTFYNFDEGDGDGVDGGAGDGVDEGDGDEVDGGDGEGVDGGEVGKKTPKKVMDNPSF